MVDTIKFSEMTDGGDIDNNKKVPGLKAGENVLFNNPWTFLPPGTTAERPLPSAEINFRLRFNTDLQEYEFYDSVLGAWTQLQDSAFTAGPFITYTADPSLPDAQNLGALANGILKQTIAAGSATLDIAVNGTDYWAPGDALTRTQAPTVGDDVTNKTYVDALVGAGVLSVQGTANQVLVNGTTGTPEVGALILTTPQDIAPASSPTFAGLTMTGNIDMGTFRATNAGEPVDPQDYATKFYVDQTSLNGTSVYAASAATLGTVTQSGSGAGATLTNAGVQATFALDGVNPPVGVNVLIKDTAVGMTAANEGIYTVTDAGSGATDWVLTRASSYDTPTEINHTGLIVVQNGSTLAGSTWYNTTTIVTVDTTNFSYSQFGGQFALKGANADITSMTGLTGVLQAPTQINDANGNIQLKFTSNALAVNYIDIVNAATGNIPSILVEGTDTDISLILQAKGAGKASLYSSGVEILSAQYAAVTDVNYVDVFSSGTGVAPHFAANGTDTDIKLQLRGKGTEGAEVLGTSTNDNATTGYVGEFISSTVAVGAPVAINTGTQTDLTSISLTAGDWDVWGNISFRGTAVALTTAIAGINTVSNTLPAEEFYSGTDSVLCSYIGVTSPSRRMSLSGTTTVYISGIVVFGSGTASMSGGIYARRRR